MTKAQKISATLACVAALLTGSMTAMAEGDSGCNTVLSDKESDTPPKIDIRNDSKKWQDPTGFVKVPPALQERGDASCRAAGFERACGYHSRARDSNDIPFPGGGYFCSGSTTQKDQLH